ncbi:3-oxo-5-alpha-steroid 4-dehydrogenase 1 isoform X3 [Scleropages formosus]|uniref:3-oxo-5-alpha-steroid 4-dehydrogenase 1 isoform X3 n=1 Tax=Scleropages formosus TaxID=113540 RepID=UPI0010FA9860|nr:3-oxo-5-alpha-steroid 4-dehydrogenase 1 isoform X3 [Scleropages formosus]
MGDILNNLFRSEAEELQLLNRLSYVMIFMGIVTFVSLLFENVPYGRYSNTKYGFPINAKLAWFLQELPAFVVPLLIVVGMSGAKLSQLPNRLLLLMFFCHYAQRSLIYPFLIRGGKATPFTSFALAFVFCTINGYMQARYLSHYAEYPADWVVNSQFISGSMLWLVGFLINLHSDHILRNLRKPGETGYKVPVGGLFEYVSSANFFGEIIEWTGFALAGHSVQSAAFAFFTLVVLTSRAGAHHRWYLEKFEDYPKSRKAVIPFIY